MEKLKTYIVLKNREKEDGYLCIDSELAWIHGDTDGDVCLQFATKFEWKREYEDFIERTRRVKRIKDYEAEVLSEWGTTFRAKRAEG